MTLSPTYTERQARALCLMSDDTLREERKAQELVRQAIGLLQDAQLLTSIKDDVIGAMLDEAPNVADWDDRITNAMEFGE